MSAAPTWSNPARRFITNWTVTTPSIARTAGLNAPRNRESRILQRTCLYGKKDFDHSKFAGYGNGGYFVYVDYSGRTRIRLAGAGFPGGRLPRARAKLAAGKKVTLVAFGDSITAGGEASQPGLIFWQRWADALRKKYPRARNRGRQRSHGRRHHVNGLARLQVKVLDRHPDLVLIAFGMNDNNIPRVWLCRWKPSPRTFARLVDRIRARPGRSNSLFSAFPPNPKWHFGSGKMEQYARATEQRGTGKTMRLCGCVSIIG